MRCLLQLDCNEVLVAGNCIVYSEVKTSGRACFWNDDTRDLFMAT